MDYRHIRMWVEGLIKECCIGCPSYRLSCLREIHDQRGSYHGTSKMTRPSAIIDDLCPCDMVMRKFRDKAMNSPEGLPDIGTGLTTEGVDNFVDDAYRAFGAIWRVGGVDLKGLEPGNQNPNLPGERSEPISEYSNERLLNEYAAAAVALSMAEAYEFADPNRESSDPAKEHLKLLREELLYRLPVR